MDSTPEGAALDAQCALHPEATVQGTCARCGSYFCAACASSELDGYCAACVARLDAGPRLRQVPWLAIVMIVHGGLLLAMGLYYVAFGVFFMLNLGMSQPSLPVEPEPFEAFFSGGVLIALLFLGMVHLVPGGMQVLGGWRLRQFRGRGLALTAVSVGVATALGCYCAPLSLVLMIWGIIVLTDRDVVARFAATKASATVPPLRGGPEPSADASSEE